MTLNQISVNHQQVSTAKLSSLGKTTSNSLSLFVLPQQVTAFNAMLLPSRFLNIDWGTKQSEPMKTRISYLAHTKASNNRFCSSAGSLDQSSTVVPKVLNAVKTSVSSTPQLLNSNSEDSSFPNKILRSIRSGLPPTLRNLFRLPISFESRFTKSNQPVMTVRRDETNYEIWVNNHLIANLPNQTQASVMQQRLNKLLESELDPFQLRPATVDGAPAMMAGNRYLFGVNEEITSKTTRSGDLIAIDWVNNLRNALKAPELSLIEGQQDMYGLMYSNQKLSGECFLVWWIFSRSYYCEW